jgi:hypothetical protein
VIAATLTTGWHYFSDIAAGGVLAVGLIWYTEARDRRREHVATEEREQREIHTRLTDELADRWLPQAEKLGVQREDATVSVP